MVGGVGWTLAERESMKLVMVRQGKQDVEELRGVPVGQSDELNGQDVELYRGSGDLEGILGVGVVAGLEGIGRVGDIGWVGKRMCPLGQLEAIVAIGSDGLGGLGTRNRRAS